MAHETEREVEKHLHEEVVLRGGTTRKWSSPNRAGVPDRIVFFKGHVYFVELKTMKGTLTVRQQREHEDLRRHGALVITLYGRKDVDKFVENLV